MLEVSKWSGGMECVVALAFINAIFSSVPHNEFGFYRVDTPMAGSQVFERKALPQTPPNLPKGIYSISS